MQVQQTATPPSEADARPRGRSDSRERIIDAAERLFADHGYAGCSFRMISKASGINQGLLHYHFASKQNLFSEIFLRYAGKVTERRMALLDAAETAAGDGPVAIETVVRCFVEPPLRLLQTGPSGQAGVRIHSQLRHEPSSFALDLRRRAFGRSTRRFVHAMRLACPHLAAETVYWRFNFMVGCYLVVVSQSGRIEDISGGACSSQDIDGAVAQIVSFLVAGFSAGDPPPPF